jgi:hypothetical protein
MSNNVSFPKQKYIPNINLKLNKPKPQAQESSVISRTSILAEEEKEALSRGSLV